MDGTSKGTALEKIFLTVADAMKKLGRSSDRLYRYKDWFAEAGFTGWYFIFLSTSKNWKDAI